MHIRWEEERHSSDGVEMGAYGGDTVGIGGGQRAKHLMLDRGHWEDGEQYHRIIQGKYEEMSLLGIKKVENQLEMFRK